jgi:hypothetical protein
MEIGGSTGFFQNIGSIAMLGTVWGYFIMVTGKTHGFFHETQAILFLFKA